MWHEQPKENGIPLNSAALERHYTVPEIAKLWNLDEKTVRKLFEKEPGVVSFGSAETRYKRKYISLRISESTLLRVHQKLTKIT